MSILSKLGFFKKAKSNDIISANAFKKADLESIFLSSDLSYRTTHLLLESCFSENKHSITLGEIEEYLQQQLHVEALPSDLKKQQAIFLVGANGSGKTSSVMKLAHHLKKTSHQAITLVAADTFRAAATEQLSIQAKMHHYPVITGQINQDPASLVFQALSQATDHTVIIDTAGRLDNKTHLMRALTKMHQIAKRFDNQYKIHNLFVFDAHTGHHALDQLMKFHAAIPIDGIVVTKLDSHAYGGALFDIQSELDIPLMFSVHGENIENLRPFDKQIFVKKLLNQ